MTLPIVIDTWWEPTDAQIAAAKAAGVGGWWGYFSNGSDRVYHGWADATFRRVLAAGLWTGAFCSGWADPAWVKSRAAALGIEATLDVEGTIRGDGAWVDPWLAAANANLYGGRDTITAHVSHGHRGYVVAEYPGGNDPSPGIEWPGDVPRPPQRVGWQKAAGTTLAGMSPIDRTQYGAGWTGLGSNLGGTTPVASDDDSLNFAIRTAFWSKEDEPTPQDQAFWLNVAKQSGWGQDAVAYHIRDTINAGGQNLVDHLVNQLAADEATLAAAQAQIAKLQSAPTPAPAPSAPALDPRVDTIIAGLKQAAGS